MDKQNQFMMDLLYLLENTFDRKRISAKLCPNPNSNLNPNTKPNRNTNPYPKHNNVFRLTKWRRFSRTCTDTVYSFTYTTFDFGLSWSSSVKLL